MTPSTFAVLTGDVAGSSKIPVEARQGFYDHLTGLFWLVGDGWPGLLRTPFQIFRGDSFQAALSAPALSLRVALVIRCGLISGTVPADARVAIGIGDAYFLREGSSAEADGEAFRRSGQLVDAMTEARLLVSTPDPEIDDEINTLLGLIDAVMGKWTPNQAEAVMHALMMRSQRETARLAKISPAAVSQRLKAAGSRAIENAVDRFERIVAHRFPGAQAEGGGAHARGK